MRSLYSRRLSPQLTNIPTDQWWQRMREVFSKCFAKALLFDRLAYSSDGVIKWTSYSAILLLIMRETVHGHIIVANIRLYNTNSIKDQLLIHINDLAMIYYIAALYNRLLYMLAHVILYKISINNSCYILIIRVSISSP